jgi:hypothetical protein
MTTGLLTPTHVARRRPRSETDAPPSASITGWRNGVYAGAVSPSRDAVEAASPRVRTFSFRKMAET